MKLFKNKYRIESTRLRGYDYSSDGAYFVTICVKNSECVFGDVKSYIMGLNGLGCAAAMCWQNIPSHFPFVKLDEWVVMPNHVHGIIVIEKSYTELMGNCVETQNLASLHKTDINYGIANKFGPQSKNLASIIRGFKIGVMKWANKNGYPDFTWQPRFHDHIIRNESELNRICEYILYNPERWEFDRNNPDSLWV